MNISIRKLLPRDIPQVLRILSLWNLEPVAPSPDCPDPEKSSISIDTAFVAVDGEFIVGIGSYRIVSFETAETMSLAVAPEYKGKGIGYLLQRARLREMREKGIRIVRTDTDRPETIQWYIRKFGYKIIGHRKKKHPSSLLDVDSWTVLELDLEQSRL